VRGLTGDPVADTTKIMKAISAQLPPDARKAHKPSDGELRKAKPPS
jgi:hypothetical protein